MNLMGLPNNQQLVSNNIYNLVSGFEGFDTEFSYLIKGYLPAQSLGVVFGPSGAFKSFHVLSWACSIAKGQDWNNCLVGQSPVLYIAGEGGLGVPRRIKAWCNKYNNGQPLENLYRIDHPISFGELDQIEQLIRTLRVKQGELGVDFGLIVIDTLARCFGGDENRTEDMNRFVSACDRIKVEFNATVLVVHHSGKDVTKGARGSGSLKAACDFEYSVSRTNSENPAFVLTCPKLKDGGEPKKQLYELSENYLFTDKDGDPVKSLVCSNIGIEVPDEEESVDIKLGKNEQSVWQAIRSRMASQETTGYSVIKGDLKAQGFNVSNYSKVVESLIKKGVVEKVDGDLIPVNQSAE